MPFCRAHVIISGARSRPLPQRILAHLPRLHTLHPLPLQLAAFCSSAQQEQQDLAGQAASLVSQLEGAQKEAAAAKELAAQLEEARAAAAQVGSGAAGRTTCVDINNHRKG